ncbi:TonB-dependent receptor [Formosa sp. Hel1_33_131]|uniref:TonB-dependent receptor n=1 Tax=Formosa sp. Hel1_33_131 TaxID=1336794 RepID=UPI00084E11FC|nr:TonB-dependent receptor [Formosa sp. Hel1_33_131]
MTIRLKKHLSLVSVLMVMFHANHLKAQTPQSRSQDTIDTQVVNIVKPYTPKISDAFKLKQTPRMGVSDTPQKSVKYTIFSIPVASTFTPAKGTSVRLDKLKKEKLFQNYASLGYGNYGTILGNLHLNHRLGRGERIGGYIEHHSSQGGIDGLQFEDGFSNSSAQINYVKSLKAFVWNTDAAFQRQAVNWYGLPFETTLALDPKQVYSTIELGSNVQFTKGVLRSGDIHLRRFSDAYDSQEYHLTGETNFQFDVLDSPINSSIKVDYLKGSFAKNYNGLDTQNYGNIQISVAPSYQYVQDDLTVLVGFKAYYLMDSEQNKNDFYIYPNVEASYAVVNSIVVAYAGIKGDLYQNTYYDFAQINPFVSPTLDIRPSSTPYKVFVGTKGKLSQSIGYDVKGSFAREQNKALFRTHSIQNFSAPNNYNQGNSFGVVYDDVDVINISGALEIDMGQKLNVRLKGDLYKYTSDAEPTAWNLPEFEASLFLDYQLSDKLSMAANLFYWGSRQDTTNFEGLFIPEPITPNVTLDAFLDANFQVSYEITNQFGAFVKVNNIANNSYNRWNHYPVQGFQILGGVSYKFDF